MSHPADRSLRQDAQHGLTISAHPSLAKDRQGATYRPLETYTFHEYILKAAAQI